MAWMHIPTIAKEYHLTAVILCNMHCVLQYARDSTTV